MKEDTRSSGLHQERHLQFSSTSSKVRKKKTAKIKDRKKERKKEGKKERDLQLHTKLKPCCLISVYLYDGSFKLHKHFNQHSQIKSQVFLQTRAGCPKTMSLLWRSCSLHCLRYLHSCICQTLPLSLQPCLSHL